MHLLYSSSYIWKYGKGSGSMQVSYCTCTCFIFMYLDFFLTSLLKTVFCLFIVLLMFPLHFNMCASPGFAFCVARLQTKLPRLASLFLASQLQMRHVFMSSAASEWNGNSPSPTGFPAELESARLYIACKANAKHVGGSFCFWSSAGGFPQFTSVA